MTTRRRVSAGAVALALAACHDTPTTSIAPPDGPAPVLAAVDCIATPRAGTVRCGRPALPVEVNGLIVGGQGTYVWLEGTNVAYNSDTGDFTFDVTVQNLIPQALGTTDGVTGTPEGVRVFFSMMPEPVTGSGAITVASHGQATFTAPDQHYYQYTQLLQTNETSSPEQWAFVVPTGVASFAFQVYVAAAVQFPDGWVDVTPQADTMAAGAAQALTASVRDVVGAVIPGQTITWGTADPSVSTVDASGNVTGVAPGTTLITATSGPRTGSASIAVCPDLEPGGVYVADMPAGASFCVAGGGSGAEYVVVPVNTDPAAGVGLSLTGAGIVPVSGPPTPVRLRGPLADRSGPAQRPRPDYGFESALRARERAMPRPGSRPAAGRAPGGPARAITPGVPAVGALMNLNVETGNACSTSDVRTGRVMAVGTHVIVMADTMNPGGGLTAGDYAAIADSFDAKIHPTVTGAFGTPSDRDGNGRVIAFYTRAVNELTPPGSGSYVGGFFFSRDLYSAVDCPTGNVGEMFYMLAADPAGVVNGNVRSASFILDQTLGTLAHELEHLINASRRMWVNAPWNGEFEDVWLDEGLAHVAEELMFYQGAGLAPRGNLGIAEIGDGGQVESAFFRYGESNFGRLRQWLLAPHGSGLFQSDDDLATRGAAWAFLRYAADRRGGTENTFWSALVNTGNTGLANLQAVLGTDPLPWTRDFAVAAYADDAAGAPAAHFTHPSWDFRELFAALDYAPGPGCTCAYELDVRDPSNGVAEAFTLSSGGAASYVRLGVPANAFGGVTVTSGGATPPLTVRLAVIRRE